MGVIRYKSTEDMMSEFWLSKKHSDSEDEEEDESARARPLLASKRPRIEAAKWNSCKFLGNQSAKYELEQPECRQVELANNTRSRSKSMADFLILSHQQQRQHQQQQSKDVDSQVEQEKSMHLNQEANRYDPRPIRMANKKQVAARRANGTRRRRRVSRIKSAASLSLSSPILSHQQQEATVKAEHSLKCTTLQMNGNCEQVGCETKASNRFQCFVDVAELMQHQQLQQQHQQPEQTNERSSCCYSTSAIISDNNNKDASGLQQCNGRKRQGSLLNERANDNRNPLGLQGVVISQVYGGQSALGKERAAKADSCSVTLPSSLPSNQQHQQQYQHNSFHYAPAPQVGLQQSPVPLASRKQSVAGDSQSDRSMEENLATNSVLMIDLNGPANKFMGSCSNSWRQALYPINSSAYKVAQKQEREVSGSGSSSATGTSCWSRQETGSANIDQQWEGENVIKGRRIARCSRPGRSPISLQRQTNARLTRHRLKIQQQRQEQLAQLALRERQLLNQYHNRQVQQISSDLGNYSNSPDNSRFTRRNISLEDSPVNSITTNHESLYLINGLQDRLSLVDGSIRSHRYSSNARPESLINSQQPEYRLALENFEHQQQHQVITPTTIRAIEICDSQLASSSGHQDQSYLNSHQTNNKRSPLGGNVIVYKSINMLRNGSMDMSQEHDTVGAGGHRGNKQFEKEIESDDAQTICSGSSTLSLNRPFCKICHVGSTKNGDKLISPCRCSGTMQYIHCGCLLKWLEISNRTNEKPMSCELCAHEYTWHKKFNYRHMRLPKCSIKDVVLHIIFLLAIGMMLFSASGPMMFRRPNVLATSTNEHSSTNYKITSNGADNDHDQSKTQALTQNQNQIRRHHPSTPFHHATFGGQSNHIASGRLAHDEKFMLSCAAFFFMSFFLAIYVQTKARDTLYGLFIKFLAMNQTYYITEYDHGQLSANNNNCINGSGGNSNSKQQQQQQQQYGEGSRLDRKNSEKS